jgi:hypothetical protein
MAKYVSVKVDWIPVEEGGRSSLPAGLKYSTVSRFKEDGDNWQKQAWSVVLEFERSPLEQGNPSYGKARFLVEDAPEDRLSPGRTFELFEGAKKVAYVEITNNKKPK